MSIGTYFKRMARYVIKGVPEQHISVKVFESPVGGRLAGTRSLITGGSRGLGYYIARRCIMDGAQVVITGRKAASLEKASRELGKGCDWIEHDVSDIAGMPAILRNVERKLGGKIDCLVSNAGISLHEGSFRNVTEAGWDLQMDTNLKGNFFMVKEYIQYLEEKDNQEASEKAKFRAFKVFSISLKIGINLIIALLFLSWIFLNILKIKNSY